MAKPEAVKIEVTKTTVTHTIVTVAGKWRFVTTETNVSVQPATPAKGK